MQLGSKECKYCKTHKHQSEFSVRRASWDGLNHKCKDCVKRDGKKTEIQIIRDNSQILKYFQISYKSPKKKKF